MGAVVTVGSHRWIDLVRYPFYRSLVVLMIVFLVVVVVVVKG